jgi:small subunit ribosomal protein S20
MEDILANLPSAKKRIRQNIKRRKRNQTFRTRARTYVKRARVALESGNAEAASEAIRNAVSQLDRAASKGIIHRKNAARRKSRLMKRLAALEKTS